MKSVMSRSFSAALADALEATGLTLPKVAVGAGVSLEQLKKVRQRGSSTNVDDALKVAHFFGLTLDEFLGDDTAKIRSEAAALFRQLSQEERDILIAAAAGRRALGHKEEL